MQFCSEMSRFTTVYILKTPFSLGGKNMRLSIRLHNCKNEVIMQNDFLMSKVNERDVKLAFKIAKANLTAFQEMEE